MSIAHLTSPAFKENAKGALADAQLQSAMHGVETGVVDRRRATVAKLPEFEALRDSARRSKTTRWRISIFISSSSSSAASPPAATCTMR